MEATEKLSKEKLIEFIHSLTEEEVKIIISFLQNNKREQP